MNKEPVPNSKFDFLCETLCALCFTLLTTTEGTEGPRNLDSFGNSLHPLLWIPRPLLLTHINDLPNVVGIVRANVRDHGIPIF